MFFLSNVQPGLLRNSSTADIKLKHVHTHTTHTENLQMQKHHSYEGPLWSFMDDVFVGEPVNIKHHC